jgi:hypothetical protein
MTKDRRWGDEGVLWDDTCGRCHREEDVDCATGLCRRCYARWAEQAYEMMDARVRAA